MKRTYDYLIYALLFIPPLIFFTDLTRNPYYFQIVLLNALTVILWMVWIYRQLQAGKLTLVKTPLDLPLWMFFAVATVSWLAMLFSNLSQPYLSYGIYNEGLKRWLYLAVNAVLAYYAAVYFTDDKNRNRFLLITFWAGMIASVYGIFQYFGVEFIWPKVLNPFGGRSVSTFGNPNFLSSYLVLLLPLLVVIVCQPALSKTRRTFYFTLLTSYIAALICTLTRSSWVGAVVAIAMTITILWKYESELFARSKKIIAAVGVIFILLTVGWPKSSIQGYNPSMMERLAETKLAETNYYGAWHQRRLIWSCAWHMINENPVLGKGWGCFELFYPFYQGRHLFLESYRNFRTHANNSHNEILEIWSQTGTLGLGIYLWFLITVLGYGFHLIKNLTGQKRLYAIALLSSLVGMWVDNLLNVSLHFAVPGFLYWWNMGLLVSLGNSEEKTIDIAKPAKQALLWLLIIIGGAAVLRYGASFMAEVHYFKGFKLSKRDLIQAAIPELEAAHNLQRLEVNNNYELANCYARGGLRDKAIYAYKESLRANAGYDEIYFNMATVMAQMGKTDEALPEYTRALYINPLSLDGYAALGSLFLQKPELYGDAGISLFKQCTFIFPQNKDVWNNLGYLYTRLNRNEEALAAYKKSLEINPDFDLAKRNLRITLARLGKKDREFEESDGLFRSVEDAIVAKNWGKALPDCERLVKLTPNSFKARFYMANIYFTVGQVERAIAEYKETLKIEPNNTSVMTNLGLAYFENKQYEAALQLFAEILQKDPQNQIAKQKIPQINAILVSRH